MRFPWDDVTKDTANPVKEHNKTEDFAKAYGASEETIRQVRCLGMICSHDECTKVIDNGFSISGFGKDKEILDDTVRSAVSLYCECAKPQSKHVVHTPSLKYNFCTACRKEVL